MINTIKQNNVNKKNTKNSKKSTRSKKKPLTEEQHQICSEEDASSSVSSVEPVKVKKEKVVEDSNDSESQPAVDEQESAEEE